MYNPFPHIKPYATIDEVEVDFDAVPDKSLTEEQWSKVRANSPGFAALYPKLNDETFCKAVQHIVNNCGYRNPCTYDGVLQDIIVPELIKRILSKKEESSHEEVHSL